MKINGVDDKEGYEQVKKAIRLITSKINAVDDKRKELKADSLEYGRRVDGKAKEITEMLMPIKDHLVAQKETIDTEKENLAKKAEEERLAKIKHRHGILLECGMGLVGAEYIWQSKLYANIEMALVAVNLETMNDASFNHFVQEVKEAVTKEQEEVESIRLAKEAADKKAEEDRAALNKEREEFERQKKELADQMAEIEKQKRELELEKARKEEAIKLEADRLAKERADKIAADKKALTDSRNAVLYGLGLVAMKGQNDETNYVYTTKNKHHVNALVASFTTIGEDQQDVFDGTVFLAKSIIEKLDAEDQRIEEKLKQEYAKKIEENRLAKEEADKKAAADKKVADEAAEAERLNGLTDRERFVEYVNQLLKVPTPSLTTKKWENVKNTLVKTIGTFLNM